MQKLNLYLTNVDKRKHQCHKEWDEETNRGEEASREEQPRVGNFTSLGDEHPNGTNYINRGQKDYMSI